MASKLANILQHFTMHPVAFYRSMEEFYEDYISMLETEFAHGKGKNILI